MLTILTSFDTTSQNTLRLQLVTLRQQHVSNLRLHAKLRQTVEQRYYLRPNKIQSNISHQLILLFKFMGSIINNFEKTFLLPMILIRKSPLDPVKELIVRIYFNIDYCNFVTSCYYRIGRHVDALNLLSKSLHASCHKNKTYFFNMVQTKREGVLVATIMKLHACL